MLRTAACIASIATALALAAPAAAERGGPANASSSISLATPSPAYGDSVEFAVSTTATDSPYVNVKCYQGSKLVNDSWASYFGTHNRSFGLQTPTWTGGAADCTATLTMWFNGRNKTLASTNFHVSA